jgi:hypothetical protein
MKKLIILLLPILFLAIQRPANAQGVSFGFPLPFPFLFYNFGPDYSTQTYYSGGYYPRAYCGRRAYYYRRPYYYRPSYYGGYYRPYYGPGWGGYGGYGGWGGY